MFSPTENSATTASVCRSAGTSGMLQPGVRTVVPLARRRVREPHLARRRARRTSPASDVRQLQRAGAREPGDAEDLARPGLEVDARAATAADAAGLEHAGCVGPGRRRPPGSRGRCRRRPSAPPALRGSSLADVAGVDPAPAAQDGDPVGELEDLVHPVRDVEHARAGAGAPRRTTSKRRSTSSWGSTAVGSSSTSTRRRPPSPAARRRSRPRSAGPASPRPGAVDVEIDVEPAARHPAGLDLLLAPQDPAAAGPRAKPPCRARLSCALSSRIRPRSWWTKRSPSGTRPAGRASKARRRARRRRPGRLVVAPRALDQRRLARAVLAHERVDLAGRDVQRDVVQRPRAGEGLRETADVQNRPAGGVERGSRGPCRCGDPPAERRPRRSPSVLR